MLNILGFELEVTLPLSISRRHKIGGVVKVDGVPAKRYITVYDRRNFSFIASTLSSAITGEWELIGLPEYPEETLLVVAMDIGGNYNAEVADYISQVATV